MSDGPRIADFGGLRVLSLESRRAELMEQLIRRHGGKPFVAPSVKEIPFEQHDEVHRWAERLFAGEFDLVVLMTGAGLSFLNDILAEKYPRGLPFNPKQTHEEWKAETAALFAEFQLWKWATPLAIRVNKLDRKEAQEAGVENMLDE